MIHWLVSLSGCRDGCPVYWFAWMTARMAVQFTGLIEWQPGWLSSVLVWLSDSQDGCPVYWFDWVTARMAGSKNGLSFSESENENISFQGTSNKGPFQKLPPQNKFIFLNRSKIDFFQKNDSLLICTDQNHFLLQIKIVRMVHRNLFYNRDLKI